MNGPEHYREAERLLAPIPAELSEEAQLALAPILLARAQVHATLAAAMADVEVALGIVGDWRSAGALSDVPEGDFDDDLDAFVFTGGAPQVRDDAPGEPAVDPKVDAAEPLAQTVRGLHARWDAVTPRAKDAVRGAAPTLAALLDELVRRSDALARAGIHTDAEVARLRRVVVAARALSGALDALPADAMEPATEPHVRLVAALAALDANGGAL